ncbi:MAG: DUF1553 domain-containing protein [Acidobacteria bacterium]|nr:DUF1553 domain-containing protein [Acidobacteriota bacterium]
MRAYWFLIPALLHSQQPSGVSAEFFEAKIRPLLVSKCFACHTDAKLGGLRLDSREAMVAGGKSGPAIAAGKPDESLLLKAVSRRHERLKMPPSDPLSEAEIALLTAWIKDGALWPATQSAQALPTSKIGPERRAFWSFQPIRKPQPPSTANSSWTKGAIDRFILAKLEEKGLRPSGPADRVTLIRRATFDLTGLPPTPEEVDAFVADSSRAAFEKVVDRLLESPRYGERWGRYLLDFARYADGSLGASKDTPLANAYRYRDWVISSLNEDLSYSKMLEAQIAADLMDGPDKRKYLPGLGFQALGGDAHERLDVITKTFLGLTVGCAQCHDHKFDPIPTADYYSLYGVLASTADSKIPLVGQVQVQAYSKAKERADSVREEIDDFIRLRSTELGEMLVLDTSRYLMTAWDKLQGKQPDTAGLDPEILERWLVYLKQGKKDHRDLDGWFELVRRGAAASRDEVRAFADGFQAKAAAMFAEKHEIDDRNYVKLGGAKGAKDERTRQYTNLESLEIEKYYLWRDLASDPFQRNGVFFPGGIYYYGLTNRLKRDFEVRGVDIPEVKDIDRFLSGPWKSHLDRLRRDLETAEKAMPPEYPFLHGVRDGDKPGNARIRIRGDEQNLGAEVPRRFLTVLGGDTAGSFVKGSGRLELARAISGHPLAARVMANRIWIGHFGQGIVRSPSNFGQLGERPTHPELLEYLSARLIESGWSLKTMHREIMLSQTYSTSSSSSGKGNAADPDNRLLWRANLTQRLDAESLRDSMLFVAGKLSDERGGPAVPLDGSNTRRTIYGYVGRTTLDPMLSLFDFPNPNNTSEQRSVTLGPMQRLYFMNNEFVAGLAEAFAERVKASGSDDGRRIRTAYRLAFGRVPTGDETGMAKDFLRASGGAWSQLTQALLTAAEFSSVN